MPNKILQGALGVTVDVIKIDKRTATNAGRFAVVAAKEELRASKRIAADVVDQEFAAVTIRGQMFRFIGHLWHEMMTDSAKGCFDFRIEAFQATIGANDV